MDLCLPRHLSSACLPLVILFVILLSDLPVCHNVSSKGSADQRMTGSAAQRDNTRPGSDGMCGECWTRDQKREYDKQALQNKILRKLRMAHPPDFSSSVKDAHLIPSIQNIINELEKEDRSRRSVMSITGKHCGDDEACSTDQILTADNGDAEVERDTHLRNEGLSGDGESSTVMSVFHLAENVVPNDPSALKFDLSKYSDPDLIVSAVLGVHVEGGAQQRHGSLPSGSSRTHGPAVIITLYRRVTTSYPKGAGSYQNEFMQKGRRKALRQIQNTWQTFNITQQVMGWIRHPDSNHGLTLEVLDHRRRPLNVLDLNCSNTSAQRPYLELQFLDPESAPPSSRPHSRSRRTAMSQDCADNTTNQMCCRYSLTLDFASLGWDWIIAPQRTSAYYCSGQCPYLYRTAIPASHVGRQTGLLPGAPCCVPTKTSDLQIMYMGSNGTLIQSTIPGLIIDKCGCW